MTDAADLLERIAATCERAQLQTVTPSILRSVARDLRAAGQSPPAQQHRPCMAGDTCPTPVRCEEDGSCRWALKSAPQDGGPSPHPFLDSRDGSGVCFTCRHQFSDPIHNSAQADIPQSVKDDVSTIVDAVIPPAPTPQDGGALKMLWTIHTALVEGTRKPGSIEDRRFLALALAGEVGEFANLVKKEWRGTPPDGYEEKIRDELGDIYAYLILEAMAFGHDLDDILRTVTLPKIEARWPSANRRAAPPAPAEGPNMMDALKIAHLTSDLTTAKGEVERLESEVQRRGSHIAELRLTNSLEVERLTRERDELREEPAFVSFPNMSQRGERMYSLEDIGPLLDRAETAEAALAKAQKVVEAAEEYFRCNPGPGGIAREELRDAIKAFRGASTKTGSTGDKG